MPIRMAALNLSATTGATKSRKAIPKDVRAEYKRLKRTSQRHARTSRFDPKRKSAVACFRGNGISDHRLAIMASHHGQTPLSLS